MNEKDLRKLRRQDLLELLLLQSREAAKQQEQLAALTEQNRELSEDRARLAKWLDEKDEKLAQLQARLEEKDAQLALLRSAKLRLRDSVSGKSGEIELQALADAFRDALVSQLKAQQPSGPLAVFKKRPKRDS